nr:LOW QUALITY PROTEIN: T-cell surface antigen CD2-like [Caretta caretta]
MGHQGEYDSASDTRARDSSRVNGGNSSQRHKCEQQQLRPLVPPKIKFPGDLFMGAECLVVLFSCVKGSANEAHKAYGVLGGSVFLNVPDFKVEKQHEITWLKNASFLVKVKNSTVKYYREREKYMMFLNGTLQIDRLVEEDGGNYIVTVYNDKGQPQVKKSLNLSFQEIVSKPEIKWICSQKLIKVICEITKRH